MPHKLSRLPIRVALIPAALLLAAIFVGCADPVPTTAPPLLDTAELQDAAERVEAAAERVDRSVEQLEAGPASDVSEFDAITIKAEALRLLALLSQIEIELDILDAIIDPRPDSRPRNWPLEREDAAALGFTSSRLADINFQLSDFVGTMTESQPVFEDESILTALTELRVELDLIRTSARELWQAHEAGEPLVAPATRLTTAARTRISRLIEALSALLATPSAG